MPRMFNFAWVDAAETTFDDVVHVREDERVYSYEFNQSEGDFASLSITILNPRIGLLATGRKVWLWFSKLEAGVQVPLFFGRLVGIPQNIFQDTITLEFIGRPADFADQKIALAETLKVAPYWDDLFVREDMLDDPDIVLEARSAMWHIDPVSHEVSISDLIVGEDGTVTFNGDDYYDVDMALTIANTPARSVTINSTIPWDNQGAGTLDITGLITRDWQNPVGGYNGLISSFTFMGLFNDWPQTGDEFSGGWSVRSSLLVNVTNEHVPPYIKQPDVVPVDAWDFPRNLPTGSLMLAGPAIIGGFGFAPEPKPSSMTYVPLGWGKPSISLAYAASREYAENLTITIKSDVQDVITLADEDDVLPIVVPANRASAPLGGVIPIGDVRRSTFALSDRGQDAIEHLIAIGRAHLITKARCVRLTFTTNFSRGMTCSLRKNALVYNPKFPGGQIIGKIVAIHHSLDGATGLLTYQVTIASCVGKGGTPYTTAPGDPLYVEDGYVDVGYQQYENVVEVLSTNDIAYSITPYEPNDDGIDFSSPLGLTDVVRLFDVDNYPTEQAQAVLDGSSTITPATYGVQGSTSYDEAEVRQIISDMPTKINLGLKPLDTGPFATDVEVVVQNLILPVQIDLEAEAVS